MIKDNNDMIETLIRYMDDELDTTEKSKLENVLQQDTALQQRYENLLITKAAIRSNGLKEKVKGLHRQYQQETTAVAPATSPKIKRLNGVQYFMRIAAVLILVIAGYGAYQYTATSKDGVFDDNFISYRLPVTRSQAQTGTVDSLYQQQNFTAVITAVAGKAIKTQKDYFLAAQSNLQNNNAAAAIEDFRKLEAMNEQSPDKYFVQETDYYLALAFIKNGDIETAKKQLQKITSNQQHMFYSKAKAVSTVKLSILEWKQ